MPSSQPAVAVIGSGVIGLTSAIRLREAGFAVTLFARTLPPHTTSDIAAAFWAPSATEDDGKAKQWALTGLAALQSLATDPASGVVLTELYSLADSHMAMHYMAYGDALHEVPPGVFLAPWSGWCATVPRIDVPIYMPWLLARAQALGVQIQPRILQTLPEVERKYGIIINCTGLGARTLTDDPVFPIRGQVLSVRKPAGLPPAMIYANDAATTTYIIPRSEDCLLGGTYQYRDGNQEVDPAVTAGILARCAVFNPALAQPEILQQKVGLRPGRAYPRLEPTRLSSGQTVIHNYGHGSVGHTLAWGCAAEVVQLATQVG